MSTFKSDSGGYSSESTYASYSFTHDQKSCSGDSSGLDFRSGSRWWLNYHGLGRDYCQDQLNVLDVDAKFSEAGDDNRSAKMSGENKLIEEFYCAYPKDDAAVFCSDMPLKHCCDYSKNNGDTCSHKLQSTAADDLLSSLMDLDSCNGLLIERSKKLNSDLDSHWVGLKKAEPWWHAADKDESASLVSQMSSHQVGNFGCLGVETLHLEKILDNQLGGFGHVNEQILNKETNVLNVDNCIQGIATSVSGNESTGEKGMESVMQESDGTFSTREGSNTAKVDSAYSQDSTINNLSRAELLEALCHSQTRAREAEKLAQEACDDKDQVINHFFHQASCLFAHRLWFRILQLETLCLRLKSGDQLIPFTIPAVLPWSRSKGMTIRKNKCRAAKMKPRKPGNHVRKCAIAFAVGLTLAGAGLLVGWTIGWLFPAF